MLSEVIRAERAFILEEWVSALQASSDVQRLTYDQLLDSLPAFLEELAQTLERAEDASPHASVLGESTTAEKHAEVRLDQGFDIAFLVHEYGLLRDCILKTIDRRQHLLSAREARLLGLAMDQAASHAISRFVFLQNEAERRSLSVAQSGQETAESALQNVRKVESALRESEERFGLLIESVQDYGMFTLSVEGWIAGWNPGAERLKGYHAEEIIGQHLARFFGPEDVQERVPERILRRAALEDHSEYEGWLVRKDGSRFWSTVSLYAMRDDQGRLQGFANVARDTTARKKWEETQQFISRGAEHLASTLDYHSTLQELARLGTQHLADWCTIFLFTADNTEALVSHADPKKEALLRRAVCRAPTVSPVDRGVLHVLRTGEAELCDDTMEAAWVRTALGIQSPEFIEELGARSFICVPLKVRGQTFAVMTLVSSTPGKQFTDLELQTAEELARRGALAVENARLFRDAQEAIRARDEFISMASHDLRTPLTTVRLKVARLLRGERDQDLSPEDRILQLEKVEAQVARLVQMMDSLLDVTTISAGRLQLNTEPLDLGAMVQEVGERLGEDLAKAGCELRVHVDDRVSGLWDKLRLEQVITNLISNALKYAKGKPIEITIDSTDEDRARLVVRDYGIGIAEKDQERMFERFERANADQMVGGFGVGLWIVQRVVEAHGGTVRVSSSMGEGSVFTVELPRDGVSGARATLRGAGAEQAPTSLHS